MMKSLLFALIFTGWLSGCTSTYKPEADVAVAKLSIRSPQGYLIHGFTYDDAEICRGRKALRSRASKRAVKTFDVEAGKEIAFSLELVEPDVAGYNCYFTVKFSPEEGQHYLINSVLDQGKRRCNNKLSNYSNPDLPVSAEFVKTALAAKFTNASAWCRDYKQAQISEDGRFVSSAYKKDTGYNGFGTYRIEEESRER